MKLSKLGIYFHIIPKETFKLTIHFPCICGSAYNNNYGQQVYVNEKHRGFRPKIFSVLHYSNLQKFSEHHRDYCTPEILKCSAGILRAVHSVYTISSVSQGFLFNKLRGPRCRASAININDHYYDLLSFNEIQVMLIPNQPLISLVLGVKFTLH